MITSISDWFALCRDSGLKTVVPWITFKDGFGVSIQAGELSYSEPRENNLKSYLSYELGYPKQLEQLIIAYAQDSKIPTKTVYKYVPTEIVDELIQKHGDFDIEYMFNFLTEWRQRNRKHSLYASSGTLQRALKKQIILENLLNV
jgi:hypothetical protein